MLGAHHLKAGHTDGSPPSDCFALVRCPLRVPKPMSTISSVCMLADGHSLLHAEVVGLSRQVAHLTALQDVAFGVSPAQRLPGESAPLLQGLAHAANLQGRDGRLRWALTGWPRTANPLLNLKRELAGPHACPFSHKVGLSGLHRCRHGWFDHAGVLPTQEFNLGRQLIPCVRVMQGHACSYRRLVLPVAQRQQLRLAQAHERRHRWRQPAPRVVGHPMQRPWAPTGVQTQPAGRLLCGAVTGTPPTTVPSNPIR